MGFVDAHMHTVFLSWHDIKLISNAGYEAVATLAYIPVTPSTPLTLHDHFNHLLVEVERLKSLGIRAVVGFGIHPRCINRECIAEAIELLRKHLPKADVLGEVGIDNPQSSTEVEVLRKQLELGKNLGKPVVVHTPRRNKAVAVRLIINLLRSVKYPAELVVIDHILPNNNILELIKDTNFFIGITMQPGKAWIPDVEYLLEYRDLTDRLLINSDAGRDPSDPLAVAKAYKALLEDGYCAEACKLASLNAREFLKLTLT